MPGSYYLQAGGAEGGGRGSVNASYRRIYYPSASLLNGAQTIQVAAGNEIRGIHLSIPLQVGYSISGVVTDTEEDGPRPYNIMVLLSEGSAESAGLPVATTVTHTDGSFIVHGVPAGDYVLVCARHGRPRTQPRRRCIVSRPGRPGHGNRERDGGKCRRQRKHCDRTRGRGPRRNRGGRSEGRRILRCLRCARGVRRATCRVADFGRSRRDLRDRRNRAGTIQFRGRRGADAVRQTGNLCGSRLYGATRNDGFGHATDRLQILLANDAGAFTGRVTDGNNGVPDMVVVAIPEPRTLRRVARYAMRGKTDGMGYFTSLA